MKARRFVLLLPLLGAVAAILLVLRDDALERRVRTRADAAQRSPPSRADDRPLVVRDGVARIDARREEASRTPGGPTERLWYGVAVDRRTLVGEPGARVRVEGHPSDLVWQAGTTMEGGLFVARVPDDVPPDDDLRLVIETDDGRVGTVALPLPGPERPALDVGAVYLRTSEALRGRCVDAGQLPAAGAVIELRPYRELRADRRGAFHAVADEHGYFEFPNVPRGLYALVGRGPEDEVFCETPVAVPRFELLVVTARDARPLEFRVLNTAGEPVAGARIVARLEGHPEKTDPLGPHHLVEPLRAITDGEGNATTRAALPGTYDVQVHFAGARFDFPVRESRAPLVIPADPRVFLRFVTKSGPLRDTGLVVGSEKIRTDGDGVAAVQRRSPPLLQADVRAPRPGLVGTISVGHGRIVEGQVAGTVTLAREPAPADGSSPSVARMERRVTVTMEDGTPVKDAVILGGPKLARTGADGWADVGEVSVEGRLRLRRPDLASGFPTTEELGSTREFTLFWNAGRKLRVTLTDARFGFPIDTGVAIGIAARAWKRVGPGEFVSRWDPMYAPPDAKILVRATGYRPVQLEPPNGPGPEIAHEVRLEREGVAPGGTSLLRVEKRGQGVPGALLHAELMRGGDEPGRTSVTAISQDDGRVILRGLKPGIWRAYADAGRDGWGQTVITVDAGRRERRLELAFPPTVTGRVVDLAGRPVGGAVVWSESATRVARTRGDGRFALNGSFRRTRTLTLDAEKAGHASSRVVWQVRRGTHDKTPIRLPRLARVEVEAVWIDGHGDPVPDDVVLEVAAAPVRGEPRRELPPARAVREGSRFVFLLGRGTGRRLRQRLGSAVAPPELGVGSRRAPRLEFRHGATVRGTVKDAGEGTLVWLCVEDRVAATRTDAKGAFAFRGVPPGTVGVSAERQTAKSRGETAEIAVEDGETYEVEILRYR